MIKVGSDFSGVGAFDQALIRLGIDYETLFACDMDKYARQTYIHNYGEPKYYPKNVYDREIPTESLDIYMTSPPCQAFSLAGKRLGEDDERGILFYNSHEFIKINKPRFFIFENVKGLLSDDDGKTFRAWVEFLGGKSINGNPVLFPHEKSVHYHIYYKVLNAKDFNIPQNRERVFIVGIRDDEDNNFTWPKEMFLEKRLKDVLESEVDEKYYLSDKMITYLTNNQDKRALPFIDDKKDVSNCIVSVYHKTPTDGQYLKVKSATSKGFDINKNGTSNALTAVQKDNVVVELRKDEGVRFFKDDCCGTIRTIDAGGDKHVIQNDYRIRKLTVRECFRLMDFPESFTWPVSDSQAYKQAGNSICVGVLASIVSRLLHK